MYIQGRSCWLSAASSGRFDLGSFVLRCSIGLRGSLAAILPNLLFTSCQSPHTQRKRSTGGSLVGCVPRTSKFFSGNLLPLATESSIELHMSFLSSFFPSEPVPVPTEVLVYVENRFELAVMFGCDRWAALGEKLRGWKLRNMGECAFSKSST